MTKRALLLAGAMCVLVACGNGSGPVGPGPNPPDAGELPCAVEQALQTSCRECHTNPPRLGAPMPMLTRADLLAPAVTQPSRRVYELVAERIRDDALPMPPGGRELSDAHRTVLTEWARGGAPAADASALCGAVGDGDGGVGDAGDAGVP